MSSFGKTGPTEKTKPELLLRSLPNSGPSDLCFRKLVKQEKNPNLRPQFTAVDFPRQYFVNIGRELVKNKTGQMEAAVLKFQ